MLPCQTENMTLKIHCVASFYQSAIRPPPCRWESVNKFTTNYWRFSFRKKCHLPKRMFCCVACTIVILVIFCVFLKFWPLRLRLRFSLRSIPKPQLGVRNICLFSFFSVTFSYDFVWRNNGTGAVSICSNDVVEKKKKKQMRIPKKNARVIQKRKRSVPEIERRKRQKIPKPSIIPSKRL